MHDTQATRKAETDGGMSCLLGGRGPAWSSKTNEKQLIQGSKERTGGHSGNWLSRVPKELVQVKRKQRIEPECLCSLNCDLTKCAGCNQSVSTMREGPQLAPPVSN